MGPTPTIMKIEINGEEFDPDNIPTVDLSELKAITLPELREICAKAFEKGKKPTMHNSQENEVLYRGEVCILKGEPKNGEMINHCFVVGDETKFLQALRHIPLFLDERERLIKVHQERQERLLNQQSRDVQGHINDYLELERRHKVANRVIMLQAFSMVVATLLWLFFSAS